MRNWNIQIESDGKVIKKVIVNGEVATKLNRASRQHFIWDEYIIKFDGLDGEGLCEFVQSTKEIEFVNNILEAEDEKFFILPETWGFHEGVAYVVQKVTYSDKEYMDSSEVASLELELNKIVRKYGLGWDVKPYKERNCILTFDGGKIYDYGVSNY